ncbi:MAG: glycoside hydrolase family 3 protein, partial [Ruminococcus sp.]|nr:glycoside hydrolase family 3 protein [Ruminococcus sp.]
KEILTDRLRDELGYDGVIITDSMSMGAIELNYQPGDAAVKAIDAGADIILMPGSIKSSFEAVKAALDDGTLTIGQIDKSVMRVLKLKEKYGILK